MVRDRSSLALWADVADVADRQNDMFTIGYNINFVPDNKCETESN